MRRLTWSAAGAAFMVATVFAGACLDLPLWSALVIGVADAMLLIAAEVIRG